MTTAVYPGSFDPFTFGHLNVLRRTLSVFEVVVVAIASNTAKGGLFSNGERRALIEATIDTDAIVRRAWEQDRVQITQVPGLIAEFCREKSRTVERLDSPERRMPVLVKGVRNSVDFAAEESMARLNHAIGGVETFLLVCDSELGHISSSAAKEIAEFGGELRDFVAPPVAEALRRALGKRPKEQ